MLPLCRIGILLIHRSRRIAVYRRDDPNSWSFFKNLHWTLKDPESLAHARGTLLAGVSGSAAPNCLYAATVRLTIVADVSCRVTSVPSECHAATDAVPAPIRRERLKVQQVGLEQWSLCLRMTVLPSCEIKYCESNSRLTSSSEVVQYLNRLRHQIIDAACSDPQDHSKA